MNNSDVTVLIPSVSLNMITQKCVNFCSEFFPDAEIIVLLDSHDWQPRQQKFRIINCGPLTISKKRNIGARLASGRLLAFIDSDAFPFDNWLNVATNEFGNDASLVAVAGPNLMPPDSLGNERLVGLVEQSRLVTINAHYVKNPGTRGYVSAMPSCNMIVLKSFYLKLGGMNEKLSGGEDFEFCQRLSETGKKILYNPNVRVWHKCRSLKSFLTKRLSYGGFAYDNIRANMSVQMVVAALPLINVLILLFLPLLLLNSEMLNYYLFYLCVFCSVIFFEALRISNLKFYLTPVLFLLLFLAVLLPGLGSLLRMLKMLPSYKKIYKNYE